MKKLLLYTTLETLEQNKTLFTIGDIGTKFYIIL